MFLSYHIFSCKIYCSCHQLHFFPWPITLFSSYIIVRNTEENHILESPLLRGIYLLLFFEACLKEKKISLPTSPKPQEESATEDKGYHTSLEI